MKTAIYIEDEVMQLVLTPESEFEQNTLNSIANKELKTEIFSGQFYDCRGGWTRQKPYYGNHNDVDNSLIVRVSIPTKESNQ